MDFEQYLEKVKNTPEETKQPKSKPNAFIDLCVQIGWNTPPHDEWAFWELTPQQEKENAIWWRAQDEIRKQRAIQAFMQGSGK